jgi:hypothetical protein
MLTGTTDLARGKRGQLYRRDKRETLARYKHLRYARADSQPAVWAVRFNSRAQRYERFYLDVF